MKNAAISILLVVVCMAGIAFAQEQTEDSSIGIDVTADFYNKYIWRGQNYVDNWVMQPGVSTGMGDFTLGIWGNLDLTGDSDADSWEFTEVDYSIDFSRDLTDGIGYSLGYIYYEFPGGSNDTMEFYGGLSFDTFLSPSVTWYYDADEANGSYVTFGLGHSIEEIVKLSEDIPVGMDIGLSVGWADSGYNEYYWAEDDDAFNDLTVSVGFPMAIAGWSVTPSVTYVTLLDDDLKDYNSDGYYGSSNDQLVAGISLGTSF